MGLTVGLEVPPLSKALPAILTSKGLFFQVNPPVHSQVVGPGEGFPTFWTLVAALPLVNSPAMHLEVADMVVGLAALQTDIRLLASVNQGVVF